MGSYMGSGGIDPPIIDLGTGWRVATFGKILGNFSPIVPPSAAGVRSRHFRRGGHLVANFILGTKKRGCCIVTSKSRFIHITWSLALTHITLVRNCFPPSTASVRYQLPAVILFKFLSIPPLLSITNIP